MRFKDRSCDASTSAPPFDWINDALRRFARYPVLGPDALSCAEMSGCDAESSVGIVLNDSTSDALREVHSVPCVSSLVSSINADILIAADPLRL